METPLTIGLLGYGKMGKLVERLAHGKGHAVQNGTSLIWDNLDVCIDFSHPSSVLPHLQSALEKGKPIVIGTTGWDEHIEEAKNLVLQSGGSALYAPNFSLGIALFSLLTKQAASLLKMAEYDRSGIEYHHAEKKDAPSGTAKLLGSFFTPPLEFTSVRCGQIPGTHTLLFDSQNDQITMTHQAKNREGFATGAILAAEWIVGRKGWWTFEDMVRALYAPYHSL